MVRTLSVALLAAAAFSGGCLPSVFFQPDNSSSAVQVHSPFTTPGAGGDAGSDPPLPPQAAAEIGIAVDRVGRQIVAANPALGIKPAFLTIGAPQPEIFHQDTSVIYITEGLVKLCKTEGQLGAVLSVELGKMISEREILVNPDARNPERRLPITVSMGNAGQFSGLDQLQQAEIAKLDCDRPRTNKRV